MKIFPAIDLYGGKAVRLYKGDYNEMTVYGDPLKFAEDFRRCGAEDIHIVDLEGAKSGSTPNLDTVKRIVEVCGLRAEIGGGIRNLETVERYLDAGVERVILGTSAVKDEKFLLGALEKYGEKIAVGVDSKNGDVAVNGWTEGTGISHSEFCRRLEKLGVRRVICTDISRDGAMKGTNREMYVRLKEETNLEIVASGGVSSLEDVLALKEIGVYGAIIGKAYYVGAIDLRSAVSAARTEDK